ncbi:uncharacterized protein LOC134775769 [Penaeus indicus]|uniref:uncharacterized protein LOC134775769 n=1 Tax=Penaeus indicus TaxID=29960 RepID=UPI00300DB436
MRLTRNIVNGFRYQVALNIEGQRVLAEVVKWTYKGGDQSVKEYSQSLGISNRKYKDIFNAGQRKILDSVDSTVLDMGSAFGEYDISLLYVILQNFCGLEKPNSRVWTSSVSGESLEHLIYILKEGRNNNAHKKDLQQMSDTKVEKELKRLKCLLWKILSKASIVTGKHHRHAHNMKQTVNDNFKQVLMKVREPLDPTDLALLPQLQDEIRVFHEIIRERVKKDSRQELQDLYPRLWDVTLAPWLLLDLKMRPTLSFTNLTIVKEDVMWFQTSQEPQTISHKELLQVKRRDDHLPDVLIISGPGGMGKTSLFKFMIQSWVEDSSQITGLENVSHLMYFPLRGSNICCLRDLLKYLLPKTFRNSGVKIEYFEELFVTFPAVFLLDGYDEVNEESKKLIVDLLNINMNMRIIITTRPGCLKELTQIMQNKKSVLNVEMKGISREDCDLFVENALSEIVEDPDRRGRMKNNILTNLDNFNLEKTPQNVPLTMKLLTVREILTPDQSSTDIYADLTKLMMGMTEERLVIKGTTDVEDKIKEYHEFQKKVALRGLKRCEHDLWPETVEELKAKCRSLNLPHREMLAGFLTSKRSQKGLSTVQTWSFPHNRFQEHWAADYIATKFLAVTNILLLNENEIPSTEEVEELNPNKNPFLEIYFSGAEEAKQLLSKEGNKQKNLLIDISCKALRLLPSAKKSLLKKFAVSVVRLLLYSEGLPATETKCDRICQFLRASGNMPIVMEICGQILQWYDVWEVHWRFFEEVVVLKDFLESRRILFRIEEDLEEAFSYQLETTLRAFFQGNVEIVKGDFCGAGT